MENGNYIEIFQNVVVIVLIYTPTTVKKTDLFRFPSRHLFAGAIGLSGLATTLLMFSAEYYVLALGKV